MERTAWLQQCGEWSAHLEGGWLHTMAESQSSLQKAGGTRGAFGVANLRLNRAQSTPWSGRG